MRPRARAQKRPPREASGERVAQRSIVVVKSRSAAAERSSPAEAALESLFSRLSVLERELSGLSGSLRHFREEWRDRVGPAETELFAAKRLEERLSRLSAEAEQWRAGPPAPARSTRRAKRRRESPAPWLPARDTSAPPAPWMELKDLYRSVVRRLHPDFARSDAERTRASELMAGVNAAYERGDRLLLELVHARIEAEHDPAEATPQERESHAAARLETLSPMAASLERELASLRASSQFRDFEAARTMSERGEDYFAARFEATREQARVTLTRALAAAESLADIVRTTRVRPRAPREPERGALLRPAAERLERQRAGRDAKAFAGDLERKATREPWVAALAFFAFFAEASPESPGTASLSALKERYDAVAMAWSAAPPFEEVLLGLPSYLEIGLRAYSDRLAFGVQLKRPDLLPGIRDAMAIPRVLPIARRVFESLGRRIRCQECGELAFELHVLRVRGPSEVHALVCPLCAGVLKSYRTLGRPEGLEALSSFARAVGTVVEQRLCIADLTLAFELLPRERECLTARAFLDRLCAVYPAALPDELRPFLRLRRGRTVLAPAARVTETVRVVLAPGATVSAKRLAADVRAAARSIGS